MQQLAALENELERLKYVQHAHIVQYLGVQRTENAMHIFMELMPGTIKGTRHSKHAALITIQTKSGRTAP